MFDSALDGVGMGLGFTCALMFLGAIREIFGAGTLLGNPVVNFEPALLIVLAPGGFIVLGVCMGAFRAIQNFFASHKLGIKAAEANEKTENNSCGGCPMAKFCQKSSSEGDC